MSDAITAYFIAITVSDKHATVEGSPTIVCGNSNYFVTFTFDKEWDAEAVKTARFVYVQNGAVKYEDVRFKGNSVTVPVMANTKEVRVGVFAGDLQTTTPARIPCEPSIRCGTSVPGDLTPGQYDRIMTILNNKSALAESLKPYLSVGGNGGLSGAARLLLLNILRNGIYSKDVSDSIDALAQALTTPNDSGDDSQGITILQVGNTLSISGVDNVSEITQTGTLLILE